MSITHIPSIQVNVDIGDKSTMNDWPFLCTPPVSTIYPRIKKFSLTQIQDYKWFTRINDTITGNVLEMLHQLVSFTLKHNKGGDVEHLLEKKPPLVCPCIINLQREEPFEGFEFDKTELPNHQKNIWVCSSTGAVVDVVIEFSLYSNHEFKIFTTVGGGGRQGVA